MQFLRQPEQEFNRSMGPKEEGKNTLNVYGMEK